MLTFSLDDALDEFGKNHPINKLRYVVSPFFENFHRTEHGKSNYRAIAFAPERSKLSKLSA